MLCKFMPNAPQTPLKSDSSSFYRGPGLGILAGLTCLANSCQTHRKRASNPIQTHLKRLSNLRALDCYRGPGLGMLTTFSILSKPMPNAPQTQVKPRPNAPQTPLRSSSHSKNPIIDCCRGRRQRRRPVNSKSQTNRKNQKSL